MVQHQFSVQPRKVLGRKVKNLRSAGVLPGNIFGKSIESLHVQLDSKQFSKFFAEVGESTLVYLQVEGEKNPRPVFITSVTRHPVTEFNLHVSFHQVDLKEKVTAPVTIKLIGEAAAEKEKLGILVQQLDTLEIEALPTDMPESIEIDISGLAEVGSNIKVSDLKLDSKLTLKTDLESIIVQIEGLAKEEVVEPVAVPEGAEVPAGEGEPATAKPEEEKKEDAE